MRRARRAPHARDARRLQRAPLAVVGRWTAGSAAAACGLLAAVWVISSVLGARQTIYGLHPPFVVGDGSDVLGVLHRNLLVLALHALACVAGFIAGSSLPLQAAHREGSRAGSTNMAGASRSPSWWAPPPSR